MRPRPTHNPECRTVREWVGPFPVTHTTHHPDCTNRVEDDPRR